MSYKSTGRPRGRPRKDGLPPVNRKAMPRVFKTKPPTEKRGRGRPEFGPSPEQRKKVEELVATGMMQIDIARVIGISMSTLVKYFDDELRLGPAKKRSEVIAALFDSAISKGNVAAMKKLIEMTGAGLAASSIAAMSKGEEDDSGSTPAAAAAVSRPGKKELSQIAAEKAAVGLYAVPTPPKLVVSNN